MAIRVATAAATATVAVVAGTTKRFKASRRYNICSYVHTYVNVPTYLLAYLLTYVLVVPVLVLVLIVRPWRADNSNRQRKFSPSQSCCDFSGIQFGSVEFSLVFP